jgi:hypothetical protein
VTPIRSPTPIFALASRLRTTALILDASHLSWSTGHACLLGTLHEEFDRGFVIGITDNQTGIGEYLYWIDDSSPDLEKLAEIIGLGAIR